MAAKEWALTDGDLNAVSKKFKDLGEKKLAELCGYSTVDEYNKALEDSEGKDEIDFNDSYHIVNDFLAQQIPKGAYVYITKDCYLNNYAKGPNSEWWEEVDDEHIETYGLQDKIDGPMMCRDLDFLCYVDDEPMENDDNLEFYGIKKHHLDPDLSWSFMY